VHITLFYFSVFLQSGMNDCAPVSSLEQLLSSRQPENNIACPISLLV